MQITRGFVTVATGDEKYYRMAALIDLILQWKCGK